MADRTNQKHMDDHVRSEGRTGAKSRYLLAADGEQAERDERAHRPRSRVLEVAEAHCGHPSRLAAGGARSWSGFLTGGTKNGLKFPPLAHFLSGRPAPPRRKPAGLFPQSCSLCTLPVTPVSRTTQTEALTRPFRPPASYIFDFLRRHALSSPNFADFGRRAG